MTLSSLYVYSEDQADMVTHPMWSNSLLGEDPLGITMSDLRAVNGFYAITQGVADGSHLRVVPRGAGNNYSVDIVHGRAAINGSVVDDQGKYVVRANGTINFPMPVPPVSGSLQHNIFAQVLDKQVDASGKAGWCFQCSVDDGGGALTSVPDGIWLASLNVTAGLSGYGTAQIVDRRSPCDHRIGAGLSRTSNLPFSANTWTPIPWQFDDDDEFNYTNLASDATKIFARHSGLWDTGISAQVSGAAGKIHDVAITLNGQNPDTGYLCRETKIDTGSGVHFSFGSNADYLPGGLTQYVQGWVKSNDSSPHLVKGKIRVYRREYRA